MRFLTLIALAALLTWASDAHATNLTEFHAAQDSLQHGVNLGRAEIILEARQGFERLAAAESKSPWLAYWVAVCDWRATPLTMRERPSRLTQQLCEHGLTAIARCLTLDSKNADALALKAGLLGLSLSYQESGAAMMLGPEMERLFGSAHALAPGNPRVAFLDALNTLHKPTFFAGGAAKAMPMFEQAIVALQSPPPADPLAAKWGRDDVYLWAGQAASQLNDPVKARTMYEAALAANPNNNWVRYGLLPGLADSISTTRDSTAAAHDSSTAAHNSTTAPHDSTTGQR